MRARGRPPAAPFLAALYLVLSMYPSATLPFRSADFVGSLLLALATALLAWLAAGLMTPDAHRRTLLAVVLVLWVGLFGVARQLTRLGFPGLRLSPVVELAIWSMVLVAAVAVLRRLRPPPDGAIRALTVTVLALALLVGGPVSWRTGRTALNASARPPAPAPRSAARPDIYLIVLDKYSRPDVLARAFDLDVTPFLDSLKALGFVVPPRARTNYVHTELVLSTLLNWRLAHEGVAGTVDPRSATRNSIEQARVWDSVRARGYRVAFFPTGFPGTVQNAEADMTLRPPVPLRERFGQTWRRNTPTDVVAAGTCRARGSAADGRFPYPIETAPMLRWKLEALTTLPDSAGPVFAFLHFLGSHEPYVFSANCEALAPWWPESDVGADSAAARRAYAAQLTCVNRLILDAVRRLLARPGVPPVILLQSDHGHGRISLDPVRGITLPLGAVRPETVDERMNVFAAYRFPRASDIVYDSITPVNVLPTVLNSVLGTNLTRSPDAAYWSTYRQPFDLTEVAPQHSGAVRRSAAGSAAAR